MHHEQTKLVNRVIEALEAGALPWRKQFAASKSRKGVPYNAVSGVAYRGMNVIQLLMTGRPIDGGWLTYKQAQLAGGNVRKGERSTVIFYYSKAAKKERNAKGEQEFYLLAKSYLVFHADQCDNLDADKLHKFEVAPAAAVDPQTMRHAEADRFIDATGAKYSYKDTEYACYVPALDEIYIQPIEQYESADAFYSTFIHELAHWSGSRLGRNVANHRHSKAYGYEELIAELTACFTMPQFGLNNVKSSVNYLNSWIKMLKETPQILTTVASQASKANAFLCAFSEAKEAPAEAGDDDLTSEEIEQAA